MDLRGLRVKERMEGRRRRRDKGNVESGHVGNGYVAKAWEATQTDGRSSHSLMKKL